MAAGRGGLREQRWRSHEQRRTLLYRGLCTETVCSACTARPFVSASNILPPENTKHGCLLYETFANNNPTHVLEGATLNHTPVHECPCRTRWGDPVHEERRRTGGSDPSRDSVDLRRLPRPPVLPHRSVPASPRYPAVARSQSDANRTSLTRSKSIPTLSPSAESRRWLGSNG